MTVTSVRGGAAQPGGFTVVTRVSSSSNVRLAVADNAALTGATFTGLIAPTTYTDSYGTKYVARLNVTGLDADTTYHYGVEHAGVLDGARRGQIETMPSPNTPANFRIGFSGDAGLTPQVPGIGAVLASTRLSNHSIYATLAARAKAERWKMLLHLGDEHYYDLSSGSHGIVGGASVDNFRRAYDDVLLQPNQDLMSRSSNLVKIVDDHDFLGNDSSGVADPVGRDAWAQVYREREPHYQLVEGGAVYHAQLIGRVLIVTTDSRYHASPNTDADLPGKTMWGEAQKLWLLQTIATTAAKFLIIATSRQWLRTYGEDTWSVFNTEREELIGIFEGLGWLDRMCMIYADRHAFHLQKADHQFGGFPVLTAAPLDAAGGDPLLDYPDGVPDQVGDSTSQYGTIDIADTGESITVTMTGWRGVSALDSYTFTVSTPAPIVVPSQSAMQALTSGSHVAAFQAKVLETYQDGDDPEGEEIPILGGDVSLDATADIMGNLTLSTSGDGTWPQRASDLLAPFGNEVFVRRGINTNGITTWVSLGYYRFQTPKQGSAPDGNIDITGYDRMSGIIIARLLAPRSYASNRTVHSVFEELVREVYPEATIIFDDPEVEFAQLGRLIESDDSRYGMLKEVADSFGKIMYWDTSGYLRIETAPDPEVPRWLFAAGRRGGVLIDSSRTLSTEGMYNCVVVTGEGAGGGTGSGEDGEPAPVRAVVFDNNPNSPTYFYGRFGPVPKFYSSPLITTYAQAVQTGVLMLRRSLGFPYNADFTISPNPAVRPWDPARIVLKDGSRKIHVINTIKVPLDAATAMTGTTKEQTLTAIGELT